MNPRHTLADAVRAAVGQVPDPELDRPLGELGMISEVRAGRRGQVSIRIALTTPGCPMTGRIRADVTRAATAVEGVREVAVEFGTMTGTQRSAIFVRAGPEPARTSPARATYAVASGKGGVGKSTVAANLAVALAAAGRSVGLIDADVWGYSVPQLFGVSRAPVAMNGAMLPVQAHGVRLMSLGFFVTGNEPVIWRGPMLHKALTQFVSDTCWGDLDVLLLDLPPGTGDVTLSVLELLPEANLVAVTTPQLAARMVAGRVGAMAREVRMPVAGVIENMTELICSSCGAGTPLFGRGGGQQLAGELGCELLGQIPLDTGLRVAGDDGVPVVLADPASPSAAALSAAAGRLRPVRRGLAGVPLPLEPVGR
jgi:ATP-binding protein involved in chromosome partitioning